MKSDSAQTMTVTFTVHHLLQFLLLIFFPLLIPLWNPAHDPDPDSDLLIQSCSAALDIQHIFRLYLRVNLKQIKFTPRPLYFFTLFFCHHPAVNPSHIPLTTKTAIRGRLMALRVRAARPNSPAASCQLNNLSPSGFQFSL